MSDASSPPSRAGATPSAGVASALAAVAPSTGFSACAGRPPAALPSARRGSPRRLAHVGAALTGGSAF
eukprot:5155244-Pyramimonas_sp.AAC.1